MDNFIRNIWALTMLVGAVMVVLQVFIEMDETVWSYYAICALAIFGFPCLAELVKSLVK